jgi:4a-hydroxytetrahydrobiopterin dehydratase
MHAACRACVAAISLISAIKHQGVIDSSMRLDRSLKPRRAMNSLAERHCVPCRGEAPPLKGAELAALMKELDAGWQVVAEHHLEKAYAFKDFRQALAFTNRVGELAETQGHHPDIYLAWGQVKLTLWTHKIDGLSESDFIFAAKVNELPC